MGMSAFLSEKTCLNGSDTSIAQQTETHANTCALYIVGNHCQGDCTFMVIYYIIYHFIHLFSDESFLTPLVITLPAAEKG